MSTVAAANADTAAASCSSSLAFFSSRPTSGAVFGIFFGVVLKYFKILGLFSLHPSGVVSKDLADLPKAILRLVASFSAECRGRGWLLPPDSCRCRGWLLPPHSCPWSAALLDVPAAVVTVLLNLKLHQFVTDPTKNQTAFIYVQDV